MLRGLLNKRPSTRSLDSLAEPQNLEDAMRGMFALVNLRREASC